MNIGRDHIIYNNDGFGADTYAVLESIEYHLKVVQDKELGMVT